MVQRIRLGELLVKAGVIDELQLRSALNEQRKWGGQLGKVLVDMGYVQEAVIVRALSKQLGLPRAKLSDAHVPHEILRSIDAASARAARVCPEFYDAKRNVLKLAMADPTDVRIVDDIAFRTGCRVEPTLAGATEISKAIDRVFFGRQDTVLDLDHDKPVRGPTTGEVGPFTEFEPSALGAEVKGPTSAPASWGGGDRFGSIDLPGVSSPSAPNGSPPVAPKSAPPFWGEPSSSGAEDSARAKLEAAQKRQNRAIRVMMDMLIERGIFTEEEIRKRLGVPKAKR